jgi:N utilization substance protein B
MTRSELRKKCMIILYQIDIYKERKIEFDVDNVIKENCDIESEFVKTIVNGVLDKQIEIDELANKSMIDWEIDHIDKTGAAIMRIGIYELKYTDTPSIVAINEAVELAKEYCDEPMRKIINATLDNILKESDK